MVKKKFLKLVGICLLCSCTKNVSSTNYGVLSIGEIESINRQEESSEDEYKKINVELSTLTGSEDADMVAEDLMFAINQTVNVIDNQQSGVADYTVKTNFIENKTYKTVTLQVESYLFTGGANGIHQESAFLFSTESGKLMNDLLTDDGARYLVDEINSKIEQEIAEKGNESRFFEGTKIEDLEEIIYFINQDDQLEINIPYTSNLIPHSVDHVIYTFSLEELKAKDFLQL